MATRLPAKASYRPSPGDRATIARAVTAKRTGSGKSFEDMEMKGVCQAGRLVGVALARVVLDA
jgi:hypothetical protein